MCADGPPRLSSDDLVALRSLQSHFQKCVVSSLLIFALFIYLFEVY